MKILVRCGSHSLFYGYYSALAYQPKKSFSPFLYPSFYRMVFLPFALWYIWINRNNNVFYKKRGFPNVAMNGGNFLEYNSYATAWTTHTTTISINVQWFPPPANHFKLNIDGSFSTNNNLCGLGSSIRDSTGTWKTGFYNKSSSHCHTMVELEGRFHGLTLDKNMNFTPLIMET